MTTKNVIFLNAPPKSGKTLVSIYMQLKWGFEGMSFRDALEKELLAHYSLDKSWWLQGYTQEQKNEPEELLGGLSRRQALIHYSEDIVKPVRGRDVWGVELLKAIKASPSENIVVDDLGFYEEIIPIISDDSIHAHVIHINRKGCDFSLDSRGWVEHNVLWGELCVLPHFVEMPTYSELYNNSSLEALYKALEDKKAHTLSWV